MDRTTAGLLHVASLRSTRAVWPFRPRQDHPLAEFELARKRSAVECFSECATELYPRIGLPKDFDLSRGHLSRASVDPPISDRIDAAPKPSGVYQGLPT